MSLLSVEIESNTQDSAIWIGLSGKEVIGYNMPRRRTPDGRAVPLNLSLDLLIRCKCKKNCLSSVELMSILGMDRKRIFEEPVLWIGNKGLLNISYPYRVY